MENKQIELDKKYLRMAHIWSENSKALKRKVGCFIVKDSMIISDGYNGTPSGFENECEEVSCSVPCTEDWRLRRGFPNIIDCNGCKTGKLVTKPYVLHAEANAITKLAKSTNSAVGATLYTTDEPCLECSKLIIQAGIKRVVYAREYHSHDGIELLKRASIEVESYLDLIMK